ncbi:MAG TPA: peptide chain release factor N(5)-glutamine methyltransferase [Tepidisphaeraceae bacterium]|jgi:release factor glutamine methyltransferase
MPQPDGPWTVERVLTWTRGFFERRGIESPRLCAELILAFVLDATRIKLYTDYQRVLSDTELTRLRELVKRAGEDEPIAYLTGRAHFYNLEFDVTRDTLIPRPDSETLVEQSLTLFKHTSGFEAPRVLDLCTGTGCVAIAVAFHQKTAEVIATDISEAALAVAKKNVEKHNLADRVTLLAGDLFGALEGYIDPRPFDLILANPPYIASAQMATLPRNVRDYEPHLALDGGPDGLSPHRRILAGAEDRLRPGGRLMMEIAFDQQEAALAIANDFSAFTDARVLRDYAGQPRVLSVTRTEGA